MPDTKETRRNSPHAEISTRAVQILREYTGRGPTMARTTIAEELVAIVFGDALLKAEKSLVSAGKAEMVKQLRHEFQITMQAALCAVVEDVIGRNVIAFMSDNYIDPDLAVEIFILEPKSTIGPIGGPPTGQTGDSDGASLTG